ncbi:hypothetical protein F4825DRAFT_468567 [Nemania diffusa]|nr:hypothetical protein F4825DRAFT_468567 [Nemania diffusa]
MSPLYSLSSILFSIFADIWTGQGVALINLLALNSLGHLLSLFHLASLLFIGTDDPSNICHQTQQVAHLLSHQVLMSTSAYWYRLSGWLAVTRTLVYGILANMQCWKRTLEEWETTNPIWYTLMGDTPLVDETIRFAESQLALLNKIEADPYNEDVHVKIRNVTEMLYCMRTRVEEINKQVNEASVAILKSLQKEADLNASE